MPCRSRSTLTVAVLLLPALAGCDGHNGVTRPEGATDRASVQFALELPENPSFISPAAAAANPNPWFPLVPGATWDYAAETEDGAETTTDAVTGQTKMIGGTEATVVRDAVYLDGELIELTFDWYAQDTEGNVWYLGEASCEWEPGAYVAGDEYEADCGASGDPAGSWEAGVGGAEAGIIMWADPLARRGMAYRQEYYEDEAEDMARVLRGDLTITVPAGTFTGCIETMDWTPLDPGAREHKYYCAGYGLVLEVQPAGGRIRNELVDHDGLPAAP